VLVPGNYVNPDIPSVFYLLTELPTYIFLSIFSVLIFFWAELFHFIFMQSRHSFLPRLKFPLLVVNVLLYVLFASILISFYRVSNVQQRNLALAYRLVLAVVSIFVVAAVMLYGGRLWRLQVDSGAKVRQNSPRKIYSNKLTIVVLACSLALLAQIGFMFANAFSTITQVAIPLVYYIVVEIVPCCVLVFVLSSPYEKRKVEVSRSATESTVGSFHSYTISSKSAQAVVRPTKLSSHRSTTPLSTPTQVELPELGSG